MSGIKFVGLSPHPPVVVQEIGEDAVKEIENTKKSMQKLAQQVKEVDPDLLITISPHGPVLRDAIAVLDQPRLKGSLAQFGAPEVSFSCPLAEEFVGDLVQVAKRSEIEMARIEEGAARRFNIDLKLDHGVLVPLYYLQKAGVDVPLVPLTMGMLSREDLYTFGKVIQLLAENKGYKVALVASGDLSHRLTPDAPAGYDPCGKEFDEKLIDCLDQLDVEEIMELDEDLVEKAGECGLRPIIIMLGVLDRLKSEGGVLSYEGPFGVGYGVATYQITGKKEEADYFEKLEEKKKERLQKIREKESEVVALARKAVETYAQEDKLIDPPKELPPKLSKQAGVFVSIEKNGNLRGCMGVTKPTEPNLAKEIINTAIKAAIKDPRFNEVNEGELKELTYKVDVLGDPEMVESKEELDPKKYGVIVRKGQATGLLLPDLEGINSVEKQLEIAKRKARIHPEDENIEMMRFEVTRYQ